MEVYRVNESDYGSDYTVETYFSTMDKAVNYARIMGYYQK